MEPSDYFNTYYLNLNIVLIIIILSEDNHIFEDRKVAFFHLSQENSSTRDELTVNQRQQENHSLVRFARGIMDI